MEDGNQPTVDELEEYPTEKWIKNVVFVPFRDFYFFLKYIILKS